VSSTQEMDAVTQEVPAVRHTRPPRRRWWPPSWRERFWAALTVLVLLVDVALAAAGWLIVRYLLMGGHG